tara:strand:+ start:13536 stop:13697 length:162 start_codon:yes stop_codon:yes gene_type:complete
MEQSSERLIEQLRTEVSQVDALREAIDIKEQQLLSTMSRLKAFNIDWDTLSFD